MSKENKLYWAGRSCNLKVANEHTSSTDFLRVKKLVDGLMTSDQLFAELLRNVEGKQLLTSCLFKGCGLIAEGVKRSCMARMH